MPARMKIPESRLAELAEYAAHFGSFYSKELGCKPY